MTTATKGRWRTARRRTDGEARSSAAPQKALFVLLLGLVGVALSLVEILGFLPDGNRAALVTLWAVAALPVAWVVSKKGTPFVVGFGAGFLMVLFAHLLTLMLWDTYATRNPVYVVKWLEGALRMDMSPRMYELVTTIPVGIMNGFAIGTLAWILVKLRRVRQIASPRAARNESRA